jgi:hypothetical protein
MHLHGTNDRCMRRGASLYSYRKLQHHIILSTLLKKYIILSKRAILVVRTLYGRPCRAPCMSLECRGFLCATAFNRYSRAGVGRLQPPSDDVPCVSSSSSSSSSFPEHLLRLLKQLAVTITSHDLRILACCVCSVKKKQKSC